VAALREKLKPHATTQRRNERTRIFLRIIKPSRGGVAAWREKKTSLTRRRYGATIKNYDQ